MILTKLQEFCSKTYIYGSFKRWDLVIFGLIYLVQINIILIIFLGRTTKLNLFILIILDIDRMLRSSVHSFQYSQVYKNISWTCYIFIIINNIYKIYLFFVNDMRGIFISRWVLWGQNNTLISYFYKITRLIDYNITWILQTPSSQFSLFAMYIFLEYLF